MSSLIAHLAPNLMRFDRDIESKAGAKLSVGAVNQALMQHVQDSCKAKMAGVGRRADMEGFVAELCAKLPQAMRADQAGGLALERELTKISSVVSLMPMPELTSLALFPQTPDSPMPGQKSYTSTGVNQTGNRLSYAYTDKGGSATQERVELATNIISPIIQMADYTINDMYAAALAGVSLPDLQMLTAKRIVEEEANNWNFKGDAGRGITGLYNLPGVTPATVANGANASPLWSSKTADEIFNDCVNMVKAVWAAIDGGDTNVRGQASFLKPNRLAIATDAYFVLATTYSASNWGDTLLIRVERALRAVVPDFMIVPAPEMNTGGGGSGLWMAAFRNDPQVVGRVVALPGEFGVPTLTSFTTSVPYHTQVGGLQSRFPVGVAIRFGM